MRRLFARLSTVLLLAYCQFTLAVPADVNWIPADANAGGGTGGGISRVLSIAADSAGNIYVGGNFTSIGGIEAAYVAMWDGEHWQALGEGLDCIVEALAVDSNDRVYAAGCISGGVAMWNGEAWQGLAYGLSHTAHALAIDSHDNVYAGGEFGFTLNAAGFNDIQLNMVARWNGTQWSAVGDAPGVEIAALAVNNQDQLFAASGVNDKIWRWDNETWIDMRDDANFTFASFSTERTALVVDGENRVYMASGDVLQRWNGDSWEFLAFVSAPPGALAVDPVDNALFFAAYTVGYYPPEADGRDDMVQVTGGIYRWDGTSMWPSNPENNFITGGAVLEPLGSGIAGGFEPYPLALAIDRAGNLQAGGMFLQAGGKDSPYLATWLTHHHDTAVVQTTKGQIAAGKSGFTVGYAGDFNKDGYGDYVVGIPDHDKSATTGGKTTNNVGRADVISGKNGAVLASIQGAAAKDALGTAVAGNGDIDNDGYDDVAVGAPNAGAAHVGSVVILYGPDGSRTQTINGMAAKNGFGFSVALGDVNGDNHADILLGTPKDDDVESKLKDAGSVTVISGNDFSLLKIFYGKTAKANAGASVASGDINGDGNADIIIGAPDDNGTGSVIAYNLVGDVLLQKSGEMPKAQFGKAVASGDLDNDSKDDVLVGAPMDDNAGLKDTGSITVISGSNSTPLVKKYGAVAKACFGNSVAAGDVNGDGKADIIVGAWKDDKPAARIIKDAGSVSVFSGDGYVQIGSTKYGEVAKDYFGTAVSAGDINSDGKSDLIIGVPGHDLPGEKTVKNAGATQVLNGSGL